MSANFNDDRPLFSAGAPQGENKNKSKGGKESTSSLKVREFEADVKRQEKLLSYSFTLVKYFLIACAALVIADVIFQKLDIKDSLASEFFDLLKYSTTSVLGYLFASERKK